MRFIRVHKLCSYLMALVGLITLLIGGALPPLMSAAVLLACAASWFWEPPRVDYARFDRLWNILTVLMLGRAIVVSLTGTAMLFAASDFVIFLTVNKLFNRRSSRDYLQLYVLSFLQMTAATVLNSGVSYGALFLIYVVATTWTLILFHLKREMEENYLLKYGGSLEGRPVQVHRVMNSRKLVGPRFLAVTSLLSLLVFGGAVSLFFLFPRVGFGYFFKKSRPGIMMTGFGDEVELGHFGLIKDDPTVVMRVEFPKASDRHRLPPYWRGVALDHYDGQRWTRSRGDDLRAPPRRDGRFHLRPSPPEADLVTQRVYLEPMDTRLLFAQPELVQIEPTVGDAALYRPAVAVGPEGEVHYQQADDVGFRYTAFSRPEPAHAAGWRRPLTVYRPQARAAAARHLQLPRLDPRVAALGARIIGDASTVEEATQRIEAWLRRTLSYSLDLRRDPRLSPLEDFLFVQRRGHCEYFATAMVILLRTQGIAARNVNGFLGGTWNSYGGYIAVSQGDAHSWVEVWLGPGRWATRDPTPSGGRRVAGGGLLERARQLTDALRMRWFKYVIEYDLDSQIGALRAARRLWRDTTGGPAGARLARILGLALAIALMALALLTLRRRARTPAARRARTVAAASELFEGLVRVYGRRGFPRRPGTTAREYLRALESKAAPDLGIARRIVDRYERVRFGGEALTPEERRALRGALRSVGRAR